MERKEYSKTTAAERDGCDCGAAADFLATGHEKLCVRCPRPSSDPLEYPVEIGIPDAGSFSWGRVASAQEGMHLRVRFH